MELQVTRVRFSEKSTQGEVSIDNEPFAYSLELPKKDYLPGSCIPPGRYKLAAYPSPHFGRLMPLLLDVPNRSEIEIHYGNQPTDSRGCILIGHTTATDWVGDSRKAFDDFWAKTQGPIEAGECWVTVSEVEPREQYIDVSAGDR